MASTVLYNREPNVGIEDINMLKPDNPISEADEKWIRVVYNTPELHGSYCPCDGCESILGPMSDWIHEIGKKGLPEK